MGGSSKHFVIGPSRRYLFNNFFTIVIIVKLINCCDAHFFSEKKIELSDDGNCFCEVNIQKFGTFFYFSFYYDLWRRSNFNLLNTFFYVIFALHATSSIHSKKKKQFFLFLLVAQGTGRRL